mgnify:CR=1 FL=1
MEIIKQIEKAKQGDQTAFTFLLDYYWNEVFAFMLIRTENETDAEDITIETFSKAFDKISTYNNEFQFNTWLIAIAKNGRRSLRGPRAVRASNRRSER